jgi:hypothetical protein
MVQHSSLEKDEGNRESWRNCMSCGEERGCLLASGLEPHLLVMMERLVCGGSRKELLSLYDN